MHALYSYCITLLDWVLSETIFQTTADLLYKIYQNTEVRFDVETKS